MKKVLLTAIALLFGAFGAQAQEKFDLDGFYINVASPVHIMIGLTDGSHYFVDDDDRKMDVEVYSIGSAMEGYSSTERNHEIADPDFVINDDRTEISTMKAKEARQFIRALNFARADVKIQVDIDNNSRNEEQRKLLIPTDVKLKIIAAYNALR